MLARWTKYNTTRGAKPLHVDKLFSPSLDFLLAAIVGYILCSVTPTKPLPFYRFYTNFWDLHTVHENLMVESHR